METRADLKVAKRLRSFGHQIHIMPETHCPYDLVMDGNVRIEVKTSKFGKDHTWLFNIHRHNLLNESAVDFYILRFEGVPFSKKPIHALYKSPIGSHCIEFTLKRLLEGEISRAVEEFKKLDLFKNKS